MSWLLAVAYVAAGTLATLSSLVMLAIVALLIREGLSFAYRTLVRWVSSPRLADQG